MSILIKDIGMPKSCGECPLFKSKYHYHGCHAVPKSFNDMDMWNFVGDRPLWCPLIELPPHGDLIDRDKYEVFGYVGTEGRPNTFDDGIMYMLERLDDAPVIVEAEGEG